MRASSLFGMTIAILIGMAVVFGVKTAGLFDRKLPEKKNEDMPRILVAQTNLFQEMTTTSADVMLRPVDPSELDQYLKNKHKYMPAILAAANLRILARNVPANEPLLREHFQDLGLPDPLGMLLGQGMRAVNLQLPRERCGGGVIRKNDRVDVYLTTQVCADKECTNPESMSAPIALGLKVVVKRDNIWTMLRGDDEGKPIPFTLEANPYRAALIEFAKTRGYLTIVPMGPVSKKFAVTVNEDKEEEQRVIDHLERGNPIGNGDIEKIFKLNPIAPPGGGSPPIMIERWSNVIPKGGHTFPSQAPYSPNIPTAGYQTPDGRPTYGYRFFNPNVPTTVPCASCAGGKRTINPQ